MLDFSAPAGVNGLEATAEYEDRFAAHMAARELWFRSLFGDTDPPQTILSPGDAQLTVHWPGGGILRFAPRDERAHWLCATSGLSQPLNDDEFEPGDASGWGVEWALTTRDAADWAPQLLVRLVKYLLFHERSRVIAPGDRVPCGPIAPGAPLDHLIAARSATYDPDVTLPAGPCMLVHLVGVTAAEVALARSLGPGPLGSLVLLEALQRAGVGLLTDPARPCLTTSPDVPLLWSEALRAVERWADQQDLDP